MRALRKGFPVIIFPEAGHTQGHYLGRFTTGAVRMAFHAAQANGYSADVKILPTAHHYSDYFDIQTDFEWQIAKPISLAPYYAAFQEHPNSVMREITRQLHSTVQALMLDEGIEDYAEKDFLRRSALRPSNLQTMPLPERLEEDKRFSAMLNAHEHYADIIRLTAELRQRETAIGVDDTTVALHPGIAKTMAWLLVLIVLLPLWLVSLWPHLICYAFPPKLMKTDKMFTNSYRYILSAVVLYPLFALLTVLVMGIAWGLWWQAVVWVLLWIPTGRFAWWYYTLLRRTRCALRRLANPSAVKAIEQLRDHLKKKIYE